MIVVFNLICILSFFYSNKSIKTLLFCKCFLSFFFCCANQYPARPINFRFQPFLLPQDFFIFRSSISNCNEISFTCKSPMTINQCMASFFFAFIVHQVSFFFSSALDSRFLVGTHTFFQLAHRLFLNRTVPRGASVGPARPFLDIH